MNRDDIIRMARKAGAWPLIDHDGIAALERFALMVSAKQPLTDEQIDKLARTMVKGDRSVNWLARAIERAHGIGGSNDPR